MDTREVRKVACTAVPTVAATISDASLRQNYLTNNPEHRDTVAARAARAAQQAAASGGR